MRVVLAILAFNLVLPPFVRPVDAPLTSRYTLRRRPDAISPLAIEFHKGLDFGAAPGTTVRAARSGVVVDSFFREDYGNVVIVRHWLGVKTLYAHLAQRQVRDGQLVWRRRALGTVGATGRTTGPHLHFEVQVAERRLPPGVFLFPDTLRRTLLALLPF